MINLIIADDDILIRESLKIILDADSEINVLETFEDGKSALQFCLTHNVDLALLDIRMPILNGVEATKEIVSKTNTKVVILTTFDEDDYINKALTFGAKGYLLKNNTPSEIINRSRPFSSGNSTFRLSITRRSLSIPRPKPIPGVTGPSSCSTSPLYLPPPHTVDWLPMSFETISNAVSV